LQTSPAPTKKEEEAAAGAVVEYETPKEQKPEYETDGDDENSVGEEGVEDVHYGRAHFGEIASPYLTSYLYNRRFLDKDYGIRKEEDGTFMLRNSPVSVDAQNNVIVHDKLYRLTMGLWERLTRKKINQSDYDR
jgi:hypothetical protein